ncbi:MULTISPECIES: 3-oxo-tetronate kinase [unclassified Microbacterium]|uniref:3-oxo-tetronate kinase n=1 Tax=unclassified Microbacterium TaxID=2609290 RepID=UPI0036665BD2
MTEQLLGAIADDFTGATDVAVAFRRAGLRTLLYFGVPEPDAGHTIACDAIVIGLKTRTVPAELAQREALAAGEWLQTRGADQLYFKYCSTFDSTPAGNIGPVLDTLSDAFHARLVVTTPSSPEHGRTVYQGHLFIGDTPLGESSMSRHPLTPMTDSSLCRLLAAQTSRAVSLLPYERLEAGGEAVRCAVAEAEGAGARYLIADGLQQAHLVTVAESIGGMPLVAGAAGLGGALAQVRAAARSTSVEGPARGGLSPVGSGTTAILAGSCSRRTLEQIEAYLTEGHPGYRLDAMDGRDARRLADDALDWFEQKPEGSTPLIYSSLEPEALRRVQASIGVDASATLFEDAMGLVARGLRQRGVTRLIVAGGETSGAVVQALDVRGGLVGPEAATGVPWIHVDGAPQLALLLKSGNFGDAGFMIAAAQGANDETGGPV